MLDFFIFCFVAWLFDFLLFKGILSCLENFFYVKTDSLVIPNHFWIFPNSTCNPPKFPKNYFFLVRNSTQMALTAPLFPLNWCQRLQNQNQKSVNNSKIWIELVSMTPKSGSNWCQRLQNLDQISVNNSKICTKLVWTAPNIDGTWSWH